MLSSGSLLPLSTHDAMLQCEEPQFAENLDFASKGDQGSPIRSVSPGVYRNVTGRQFMYYIYNIL